MTPSKLTWLPVFFLAAQAAAQQATACNGPGAPFGVIGYRCASCGTTTMKGERTKYVFQSEPVILEVMKGSVLQSGDVIEAVNDQPIMTEAGAEQFAYPTAGRSTIAVRRGNTRLQLSAVPGCVFRPAFSFSADTLAVSAGPLVVVDGSIVKNLSDVDQSMIDSVDVLKGPAATALYGTRGANGVILIKTKRPVPPTPGYVIRLAVPNASPSPTLQNEPLYVIDGVVVTPPRPAEQVHDTFWGIGRYGFAIACQPSCTRAKASDGTDFYKFDGYPPVVAVVAGGVAERAGIKTGDLVTQIDGKSMLEEEGALRFFRGNKTETLRVTVLRDRKLVDYVLKSR